MLGIVITLHGTVVVLSTFPMKVAVTKDELKQRFQEIINRDSGDTEHDMGDALDALFEYVDDPEIQEMYERYICW